MSENVRGMRENVRGMKEIVRLESLDVQISVPNSLVRYVVTFRYVYGGTTNAADATAHVLRLASVNNELFLDLC